VDNVYLYEWKKGYCLAMNFGSSWSNSVLLIDCRTQLTGSKMPIGDYFNSIALLNTIGSKIYDYDSARTIYAIDDACRQFDIYI